MASAKNGQPFYCAECGVRSKRKRKDQEFHDSSCRMANHGRRIAVGYKLYDLAINPQGHDALMKLIGEVYQAEQNRLAAVEKRIREYAGA